jgi:hypothetical protein
VGLLEAVLESLCGGAAEPLAELNLSACQLGSAAAVALSAAPSPRGACTT